MTRILTIIAAVLIILGLFFMFRNPTKDYKTTPPVIEKPSEGPITADSDFHTWKEFSPDNGLFKVMLPATPQHVSDMVIDPKTLEPRKYETFALAANDGSAYVINVISLPPEAKPDEEVLKAAVTDMLERNKENKLKNMKMGSLNGKPALDFSFENSEVSVEGKVIANENRIYILTMVDKDDAIDKKNFDFFVNSFHLVEEKK